MTEWIFNLVLLRRTAGTNHRWLGVPTPAVMASGILATTESRGIRCTSGLFTAIQIVPLSDRQS